MDPHFSPRMTSDRLALIVVGVVFTAIGILVVVLRLLAIALRRRPTGKDDWSMLAAWLSSIGFAIASFVSVRWGVGYATTEMPPFVPPFWEENAIKAVYVIEIFYYITVFFLKMSILFLYLRLAHNLHNRLWKGTLVTMGIIIAQFITTVIVVAIQCKPMDKYWDGSMSGRCVNITAFFYSTNVFTILTDLVIIGLPIPTLLKLQQPRATKIGLLAAFLVGGVSSIASCVRLYSVRIYTESHEALRDAAPINTWSFIEIYLGILCASVPAIKPLFMASKKSSIADSSPELGAGKGGENGVVEKSKVRRAVDKTLPALPDEEVGGGVTELSTPNDSKRSSDNSSAELLRAVPSAHLEPEEVR